MSNYTIAMVGYDISHLSGYIRELELESEKDARGYPKWEDGIDEYSLNVTKNAIGYDYQTRTMFGTVIWKSEDADYTEEGTGVDFELSELLEERSEIWAKYKQFLFDHTKITDKTEPPFIIKFISFWS